MIIDARMLVVDKVEVTLNTDEQQVHVHGGKTLKPGLHCNADLWHCNVTDVLGQCEHCSSVIAVAVLTLSNFSDNGDVTVMIQWLFCYANVNAD